MKIVGAPVTLEIVTPVMKNSPAWPPGRSRAACAVAEAVGCAGDDEGAVAVDDADRIDPRGRAGHGLDGGLGGDVILEVGRGGAQPDDAADGGQRGERAQVAEALGVPGVDGIGDEQRIGAEGGLGRPGPGWR